jgi:hypothetical protein
LSKHCYKKKRDNKKKEQREEKKQVAQNHVDAEVVGSSDSDEDYPEFIETLYARARVIRAPDSERAETETETHTEQDSTEQPKDPEQSGTTDVPTTPTDAPTVYSSIVFILVSLVASLRLYIVRPFVCCVVFVFFALPYLACRLLVTAVCTAVVTGVRFMRSRPTQFILICLVCSLSGARVDAFPIRDSVPGPS